MLTSAEIVRVIRMYEAHSRAEQGALFRITRVVEVASGVVVTRDSDGEHSVFFDQSRYFIPEGNALDDMSSKMNSLRGSGVGFFFDVTSKDVEMMTWVANEFLRQKDSKSHPRWHEPPKELEFTRDGHLTLN